MFSISAPFIRRPIATFLLAVGMMLAGVVAFVKLPVSAMPRVDLPTIFVQVNQPGANPETLAANIAQLQDTHRIERCALFDQFPYTHHMESGVLLVRR